MSYLDPAPPVRPLVLRAKWAWEEFTGILMHSDIRFACVVLGLAMGMWACFGLVMRRDLEWFAMGFALEFSPWLWAVNHWVVGLGFIHVALHKLPKGRCLALGTYAAVVWGWIAMGRPASTFSSGVTLNIVIIFMAMLIVQRSGAKK